MRKRGTATVVNGVRYRSAFEAAVAADLIERGVAPHHEEKRIPYSVPHVYVADFAPRADDGEEVIVEAKGYLDAEDRRKLLQLQSEGIDIHLVFQNAKAKLRRGSKTTYGMWATQNGFKWTEGRVAREWIGR